jgi:hypothetical protein
MAGYCLDRPIGMLCKCPFITGEGGFCEDPARKGSYAPCKRIQKFMAFDKLYIPAFVELVDVGMRIIDADDQAWLVTRIGAAGSSSWLKRTQVEAVYHPPGHSSPARTMDLQGFSLDLEDAKTRDHTLRVLADLKTPGTGSHLDCPQLRKVHEGVWALEVEGDTVATFVASVGTSQVFTERQLVLVQILKQAFSRD